MTKKFRAAEKRALAKIKATKSAKYKKFFDRHLGPHYTDQSTARPPNLGFPSFNTRFFVVKGNHNNTTNVIAASNEVIVQIRQPVQIIQEVDTRTQPQAHLQTQHVEQNEGSFFRLGSDKYILSYYDKEYDSYINGFDTIRVGNILVKHLEFWENTLRTSNYIINIIRQGYRIPFHSDLPVHFLK